MNRTGEFYSVNENVMCIKYSYNLIIKIMENISTLISYQEALKILTPNEINVLELVEKGFTNKEIAIQIGNSIRTIHTHRYNIGNKLNVKGANGLQKWLYLVKSA